MFTASCNDQPEDGERDERLHGHGDLCPASGMTSVGLEGGGVGEAQVQVVDEPGPPARLRDPGFSCCGKPKSAWPAGLWARAAAPPPSSPRAARTRCCSIPTRQCRLGADRLLSSSRATVDEVVDQQHRRPERVEDEDRNKDDESLEPLQRRVILPGSPATTATSNKPSMSGATSPWAWPQVVG